MAVYSLIVLFLVSCAIAFSAEYPKVKVELYYESKCPYCQTFIVDTLSVTLAKSDIAAIVDLKMVPYGNTKYSNGVYTCQHGEDECTSDVYELCALYKLGDISSIGSGATSQEAFPFLLCLEKAEGNPAFAQSCYASTLAKTSSVSWETISKCFDTESAVVQGAAKDATVAHDYVPWPLVNGVLLNNTNLLQQTICKDYTGPAPSSCKRLELANQVSWNK